MTLKELVGEHVMDFAPMLDVRHPFDTDASGIVFGLDGVTYLLFEDPNDGYRSSAGIMLSFAGAPYLLGGNQSVGWIREPVLCSHETADEYGGENDILAIRSKETGQLILRVGTDNVDDYYPSFVCQWSPSGLSANAKARL